MVEKIEKLFLKLLIPEKNLKQNCLTSEMMQRGADLEIARRNACRDKVHKSYQNAKADNRVRYLHGDPKATEEYIYPNQIEDATRTVDAFTKHRVHAISIQKRTKIGADGFMIETAYRMATHPDDDFVIDYHNIRILTGMSNASWQTDFRKKSPDFLAENIFHHGQLSKANLIDMKNGLLFIDEIDVGDKEFQRLHSLLIEADVLTEEHMINNNMRFVFISATLTMHELHFHQWGSLHETIKLTIPPTYIGHERFLELGIIQESYPLVKSEAIIKWVNEDILRNYGTDYRVHLVRVRTNQQTNEISRVCMRKGIIFKNHCSERSIPEKELEDIFSKPLTQHVVIAVKRYWSRADLIPNNWKLRIGATHELFTKKVDNNVQVQAFPGRMTGYWRPVIEEGHKTGPFRTSVTAIEQYVGNCEDPFGPTPYRTAGLTKKSNGSINLTSKVFVATKHVDIRSPAPLPDMTIHSEYDITEPFVNRQTLEDTLNGIIKTGNITKYEVKVEGDRRTIRYRGVTTDICTYENATQFKNLDITSGMNKRPTTRSISARMMPVIHEGQEKWIGIYVKKASEEHP